MRMGTENEYNSFIATCSLGFLVAESIELADRRKAAMSFLQEKERSFPFEIKQPRYFHSVTYSIDLLFKSKVAGFSVLKRFPKIIALVFLTLKERQLSRQKDSHNNIICCMEPLVGAKRARSSANMMEPVNKEST